MEESQISTLLTTKICRSVDVPAVAVMIVLHDLLTMFMSHDMREHSVGYALIYSYVDSLRYKFIIFK